MDDGKGRDTVPHCGAHHDRAIAASCRRCGVECCESCLVFSFGEGKAPFCPSCALVVAGLDAVTGPRQGADPLDTPSRLAVG